jgi:hypothetical protein
MIDASSFGSITGQIDYGERRMPLTGKGQKIMNAMQKKYGAEKGKQVFYASKNKGTISGVEEGVPEGIANTLKLKEEQRRKLPRLT